MTREEWLQEGVNLLRQDLLPEATKKILVSVGWPGGRGNKDNVIGQCWHQPEDKSDHIFVSPVLATTEDVLSTLLHEMIHVVAGADAQHGGEFITLAKRVGFTTPWRSTPVGEELRSVLLDVENQLGSFPHEGLVPMPKTKTSGTRMLKLECPACMWACRTTRKHIDNGLPTCFCGTDLEEVTP